MQRNLLNRICLLLSLTLLTISCNQSDKKETKSDTKTEDTVSTVNTEEPAIKNTDTTIRVASSLEFLREYAGKYPNDIKLLENPELAPRLKTLLGDRYTFFKETWAVESPMEMRGDHFVASACMAHNCGSTNFIIVADLKKDKLYAGIREGDKVKKYAEDGSSNVEVDKWAQ